MLDEESRAWADRLIYRPDDEQGLVVRPTHWLLTTGWRKHGLLDPGELPKLRRR